MGQSWAVLEPSGVISSRFGAIVGCLQAQDSLKRAVCCENQFFLHGISAIFVRCFEAIFGCFGASCDHLGAILGRLRVLLGRLGQSWDHLGIILGRLEAILEPSSAVLGSSWGYLGRLGLILGHLRPVSEPSWGNLGGVIHAAGRPDLGGLRGLSLADFYRAPLPENGDPGGLREPESSRYGRRYGNELADNPRIFSGISGKLGASPLKF